MYWSKFMESFILLIVGVKRSILIVKSGSFRVWGTTHTWSELAATFLQPERIMLPGNEKRKDSTTERERTTEHRDRFGEICWCWKEKKGKTVEMTPNPTPTGRAGWAGYDNQNGNLVRCRDNNLISDHNEVPCRGLQNFTLAGNRQGLRSIKTMFMPAGRPLRQT